MYIKWYFLLLACLLRPTFTMENGAGNSFKTLEEIRKCKKEVEIIGLSIENGSISTENATIVLREHQKKITLRFNEINEQIKQEFRHGRKEIEKKFKKENPEKNVRLQKLLETLNDSTPLNEFKNALIEFLIS